MSEPTKVGECRPTRPWSLAAERLLAAGLAALLLRGAFAHLGNPYYFLSTVYSYRATGIELGRWVAVVLPYLELVAAVCLLARRWTRAAYLLAFLLFGAFAAVQTAVAAQGLKISCGCFGTTDSLPVGRASIAVAATAAAFALVGSLVYRSTAAARPGR